MRCDTEVMHLSMISPIPPHLGRGGGYVGLRSYNLCPMVGESPIDTN